MYIIVFKEIKVLNIIDLWLKFHWYFLQDKKDRQKEGAEGFVKKITGCERTDI